MTDLDHGKGPRLDLGEVRRRLESARGPQYWRSLEELAGDPEFQELLARELPRHAAEWPEGVSRRSFLALSAASLALGGLTACTRQPAERIVPYVRQPEEIVPGRPLYYASAAVTGGFGLGVLVETHMGRPTKVEGNPEHPGSLGATDVAAQASILSLYDPDRSQVAKRLGRIGTWPQLVAELRGAIAELGDGTGLRILTRTVTSPTLAAQLADVRARFPGVRWHRWEPAGRHSARAAARAAFGRPADTRYDLSKADVVLALDADFLTAGPGWVRNARDFARRRKVTGVGAEAGMNRLYAVESSPTATAAQADHRLALPPGEVAAFAAALAAELGAAPAGGAAGFSDPAARTWIAAVAEDLKGHRGAGAVIPGDYAPPEVHVLAHALNETLGNVGGPVLHVEPVEAEPEDHFASIAELTRDIEAGEVEVLLILGGNPVYDAPADLDLAAAMEKVRLRIHLSPYEDETSAYCQWHLPLAHELESWGDVRAVDGTATLVQPTIEPLYGGRTAYDLLALFGEVTDATAYELLREHWRAQGLGGDGDGFEKAWRRALHDGVIPGTESPAAGVTVDPAAVAEAARSAAGGIGPASDGAVELVLRPDPAVDDGTWANNGWLQELPRPLTKLTWDNAVLLAPATAEELGVATEDTVEVEVEGRTVTAPVFVLPGHAPGAATVHLGYGRSRSGRVATGAGFDAYRLRTTAAPWVARGARIRPAGGTYPLATTQTHQNLPLQTAEAHARHLVRHGTLERYRSEPEFARQMGHPEPGPEESMFPPHPYEGYAWGLSIDLTSCLGCNACVVACQSENNIPVVGKDQVHRGREMQWIRIDRYFEGDLETPAVHHQPVMCMHCELAPCEVVCPVGATVHSDEGLNDMVYNRCVGTRYCSNNCPYKVRRFNFLLYSDTETEVLKMARNPDVTVRTRGVMEKCTYCVQRINGARIDAEREGRKIRDGEITTACQQACPAEAITFGDVNDPDSAVSRLKASPLTYSLLGDLGTRPRTTYLAKLTNPNPALAGAGGGDGEGEH